jgi:hypothetical protein
MKEIINVALRNYQGVVEIIFAVAVGIALIQAGYNQVATIVVPIITGVFGYMKGVSDGKSKGE